ncbi:MAG TPA: hypothetical protein ENJ95_07950 [Bacteroidetes bacterium]|nr:hypothetical protein [Bacteroidota bacterium]
MKKKIFIFVPEIKYKDAPWPLAEIKTNRGLKTRNKTKTAQFELFAQSLLLLPIVSFSLHLPALGEKYSTKH